MTQSVLLDGANVPIGDLRVPIGTNESVEPAKC